MKKSINVEINEEKRVSPGSMMTINVWVMDDEQYMSETLRSYIKEI